MTSIPQLGNNTRVVQTDSPHCLPTIDTGLEEREMWPPTQMRGTEGHPVQDKAEPRQAVRRHGQAQVVPRSWSTGFWEENSGWKSGQIWLGSQIWTSFSISRKATEAFENFSLG